MTIGKKIEKDNKLSFENNTSGLTHKLIIGDNYDVLIDLQQEYTNKVDFIYIDPPYNTKTKKTYNDKWKSHRDWLDFISPRLQLARKLLSDKGVIFISIDDNEQAYLKVLCDDVFGEENFVCNFIWETTKSAQGMIRENMLVENHEYILCYKKNTFKFKGIERDESDGFSNPDNDKRGVWKRQYLQRIGQGFPVRTIIDPKTNISYSFETPYTEEKMNNWIKDNRIIFPSSKDKYPARKEFLNEYPTNKQLITSLGLYATKSSTEKLYSIFNNKKIFQNPKPVDLIKFLVEQSTNKDSIILDFFAGSGTTGQAVMELNEEDGGKRQFILCTNNENGIAENITYERLYRVINGVGTKGEQIKWQYSKDKKSLKNNNLDVFRVEYDKD